jgi:hypothetical protein
MTNEISPVPTPGSQALSRLPIFGPPALLPGEDAAAYDQLLASVSGNLKPSDIFEEIWVHEIVDLAWDSFRWRRLLAGFLQTAIPRELERILKPLLQNQPETSLGGTSLMSKLHAAMNPFNAGQKLAADWVARDPEAITHVNELLASAGMTMDHVHAQATASELEKIERFNRLNASAEGRRNTLLREIEHHRAPFAQRLRPEISKIEDAEFVTVEPDAGAATGQPHKIAA